MKLKDCPFCGCNFIKMDHARGSDGIQFAFRARCPACRAMGPIDLDDIVIDSWGRTKDKAQAQEVLDRATERWNQAKR